MTDPVAEILQKDAIINCINQLFIATDNRDWSSVSNCLAEHVNFDMTSLSGGSPGILTRQQIIEAWEAGLRPLHAIHHQIGNYQVKVEGQAAKVFCYGIASHFRPTRSGRNTRVFVGSYDFELSRKNGQWIITSFRFNLKYIDGNLELEKSE